MSLPAPGPLKKTPLNARHRALGARMVEFGGWDMPVEYSGIVDEHMAQRGQQPNHEGECHANDEQRQGHTRRCANGPDGLLEYGQVRRSCAGSDRTGSVPRPLKFSHVVGRAGKIARCPAPSWRAPRSW